MVNYLVSNCGKSWSIWGSGYVDRVYPQHGNLMGQMMIKRWDLGAYPIFPPTHISPLEKGKLITKEWDLVRLGTIN